MQIHRDAAADDAQQVEWKKTKKKEKNAKKLNRCIQSLAIGLNKGSFKLNNTKLLFGSLEDSGGGIPLIPNPISFQSNNYHQQQPHKQQPMMMMMIKTEESYICVEINISDRHTDCLSMPTTKQLMPTTDALLAVVTRHMVVKLFVKRRNVQVNSHLI